MTETEMVEVLHVILETICVLISRIVFQIHWTCFLLEILIPKVKPTAIRIFYRPSNLNDFLNTFSKNFQQIDTFSSNFQQMNYKTSEVYFLGDFDINLLQNGKIILKENQSNERKNSISALVNKYTDFCQTFSLTVIIKEPTRITCFTSLLLDHILTNFAWKNFPKRGNWCRNFRSWINIL